MKENKGNNIYTASLKYFGVNETRVNEIAKEIYIIFDERHGIGDVFKHITETYGEGEIAVAMFSFGQIKTALHLEGRI